MSKILLISIIWLLAGQAMAGNWILLKPCGLKVIDSEDFVIPEMAETVPANYFEYMLVNVDAVAAVQERIEDKGLKCVRVVLVTGAHQWVRGDIRSIKNLLGIK